jgi:P pilus assembly chaperone PapD
MKKLKRPFIMLITIALMATVLAPAALAQPAITRRLNGNQRATTATMTNGQSARVVAWVQVSNWGDGNIAQSQPTLLSATSPWVSGAPAIIEWHRGWIA